MNLLSEKGLDALVFINQSEYSDPNILYFTGYSGQGALVISGKKKVLVIPKLEEEKAKRRAQTALWTDDLVESISKIDRFKNVGVILSDLRVPVYRQMVKKWKLVDIKKDIEEMRSVKTKKEIEIIKEGVSITEKIFRKLFSQFSSFTSESEAAAFLVSETMKKGCAPSFDPIIASGASASQPHFITSNTKIRKGFCVIDYGIRYKNYCTDMTRTLFIGNPNEKQQKTYNTLLEAQRFGVDNCIPGVDLRQLQQKVGSMLGPLKKLFIHSLGHGIGVQVHESPFFNVKARKNQVVTIEPGIYSPEKFGIRIEDMVIINNKPKPMQNLSKELKII